MAINLDNVEPIDPTAAEYASLMSDLQGNILKAHGRDHTAHVFIRFGPDVAAAASWIGHFAETHITSAKRQHEESLLYREADIAGTLFGNLYLTARGYQALGLRSLPNDPKFRAGMKASGRALHDPDPKLWEECYRDDIHAMILLADDIEALILRETRRLRHEIEHNRAGTVLGVEFGRVLRNKNGYPIEHFGYVDSISQPLFFKTKSDSATVSASSPQEWNPYGPLSLVLVQDPNGETRDSYGSYLVFRKLEQDVRGFELATRQLARAIGMTERESDHAGALVIGRFPDGHPITTTKEQPVDNEVSPNDYLFNDFNYARDDGTKCPFHAHIRKVNPRGDSISPARRRYGPLRELEAERRHRIVRRGIPYGRREIEPKDKPRLEELPTNGVGLLFMCFQSDIQEQYEFLQARCANDEQFPVAKTGVDPLIGQGGNGQSQLWPKGWGEPTTTPFNFMDYVHLLGGEYFFAPSISFLKKLSQSAGRQGRPSPYR